MNSMEALVLAHDDHPDALEELVGKIFGAHELPDAVHSLEALLRSGDRERIVRAEAFIRDVVIYGVHRQFTALLPHTGIFPALGQNLYAPDYLVRGLTIFTLGKITFPRNAPLLIDAFPWYLERDPIGIPSLVGELFWLSRAERRRRWEYFESIARSPHYLARWSFFEAAGEGWIGEPPKGRDARLRKRWMRRLAQDPNQMVRREARSRLDGLKRSPDKRMHSWHAPRLCFENVSITFRNYLWASDRRDYDVALLDAWVQYRRTHEIDASISHEEDAEAFEAWRGSASRDLIVYSA